MLRQWQHWNLYFLFTILLKSLLSDLLGSISTPPLQRGPKRTGASIARTMKQSDSPKCDGAASRSATAICSGVSHPVRPCALIFCASRAPCDKTYPQTKKSVHQASHPSFSLQIELDYIVVMCWAQPVKWPAEPQVGEETRPTVPILDSQIQHLPLWLSWPTYGLPEAVATPKGWSYSSNQFRRQEMMAQTLRLNLYAKMINPRQVSFWCSCDSYRFSVRSLVRLVCFSFVFLFSAPVGRKELLALLKIYKVLVSMASPLGVSKCFTFHLGHFLPSLLPPKKILKNIQT